MDVYGAPQAGVRPPDRLGNAPKASLQLFARQSKPAAKQETQKSSAAAGSLQSRLQRAGSFNRGVRGEQASRGAANENEVPADPAFASQPAGPSCLPADAAAAAASKYLSPSIIRQGSIIARKVRHDGARCLLAGHDLHTAAAAPSSCLS